MIPAVTPVAVDVWTRLGPWGEDDENQGYPLLLWVNGLVKSWQPILDVISDQPDGTPGWAIVMDPATAPASWLPWLGQFAGVKVDMSLTIDQQRVQIVNVAGRRHGTVEYLVGIMKQYLVGTQTVIINERDTSPYHFTVQYYDGELSGDTYSSMNARFTSYVDKDAAYPTYADMTVNADPLVAAVNAAKPAGLVMAVVALPGTP